MKLKMYADAAFASNNDLSSQLESLILLIDPSCKAHVFDYLSKNSKRVVCSIMGGEIFAFVDGFEKAFMLCKDLEKMSGINVPLFCFTDSKQVFDSVTKGQSTTEKRLMVDAMAARES